MFTVLARANADQDCNRELIGKLAGASFEELDGKFLRALTPHDVSRMMRSGYYPYVSDPILAKEAEDLSTEETHQAWNYAYAVITTPNLAALESKLVRKFPFTGTSELSELSRLRSGAHTALVLYLSKRGNIVGKLVAVAKLLKNLPESNHIILGDVLHAATFMTAVGFIKVLDAFRTAEISLDQIPIAPLPTIIDTAVEQALPMQGILFRNGDFKKLCLSALMRLSGEKALVFTTSLAMYFPNDAEIKHAIHVVRTRLKSLMSDEDYAQANIQMEKRAADLYPRLEESEKLPDHLDELGL